MFQRAAILLAGLGGVLAFTARAASQEDALETFGESLDVVVVEVEAVVTDRNGRRVTGLTREDFRLFVDGQEVPIEYFSEVREGRTLPAAADSDLHEPTTEDVAPPDGARGDPVVTNHLVFVDDYFAIRSHRNSVLRGLRAQLPALPARDRMALVAFDGETIDILTPWTSAREELADSIGRALKRPARGLFRAHERRRRGEEGPWADSVSQEEELRRVLTAVRSTLQVLPRPEGRKVLLLLGGGWPSRSGGRELDVELLDPDVPPSTWTTRFDDRALARELADTANLLGYTVYPVDVQGLRAGRSTMETASPSISAVTGQAPARRSRYTGELFRQGSLRFLAEETGGRALLYDDRVQALEAELADTRNYYSLAFMPELRGDGFRHDILVEVPRPGLEVRARGGFQDVSRAEELDLLTESALRIRGLSGSSAPGTVEGGLVVSVGEARRSRRRTMEVPLRVDVPWSEVTALPDRGRFLARVEIRVVVRDREGTASEMTRIPIVLIRKKQPSPTKILRWETDVTLRRERHDLVVSLYDAHSGRVLTRVVSVEP